MQLREFRIVTLAGDNKNLRFFSQLYLCAFEITKDSFVLLKLCMEKASKKLNLLIKIMCRQSLKNCSANKALLNLHYISDLLLPAHVI